MRNIVDGDAELVMIISSSSWTFHLALKKHPTVSQMEPLHWLESVLWRHREKDLAHLEALYENLR